MQLLSGIAQLLTRPPSTPDHRPDPSANLDTLASHGGEEGQGLEGLSGVRVAGVSSDVPRRTSTVSFILWLILHAQQQPQNFMSDHACRQKKYNISFGMPLI